MSNITIQLVENLLKDYQKAYKEKWDYNKLVKRNLAYGICYTALNTHNVDIYKELGDVIAEVKNLDEWDIPKICDTPCDCVIWKDSYTVFTDHDKCFIPRITFLQVLLKELKENL